MQKLATFFQTFIKSATSPAYYADVLKAKFSFSVKYFVFFNLLLAIVTAVRIMIPVAAFDMVKFANEAITALPQDLEVKIADGRVDINKPLPYAVPFPMDAESDAELPKNLVVFTTDDAIQTELDFDNYDALMVFSETQLYARDKDTNEVKMYPISTEMKPLNISSAMVKEGVNTFLQAPPIRQKWYVPVLGLLLVFVILPFMILARLWTLLIYSLMMLLIVWILKGMLLNGKSFRFGQIFQVSLHTITPLMLAAYLIDIVTPQYSIHGWVYFFIYVAFTIVALRGAAQNEMPMTAPVTSLREAAISEPKPKRKASKKK